MSLITIMATVLIVVNTIGSPPSKANIQLSPQSKPNSKPEPPRSVTHTVKAGETLSTIAASYGLNSHNLRTANPQLGENSVLKIGMPLIIPGVKETKEVLPPAPPPPITDGVYHVLEQGQTLSELARMYNVSIETLAARNQLTDEHIRALREGRSIVIPGITREQQQKILGPTRPRSKRVQHTVNAEDNIWGIAREYDASVGEIMSANALTPETAKNLKAGMTLIIPNVEQHSTPHRGGVQNDRNAGRIRTKRSLSNAQQTALASARRLGLGSRTSAGQLLHGRVSASWLKAVGGGKLPGDLRWPVSNGWYVRGYGSGEGGYHLATDIMGKIGWNVRAAASGIVGYAGNELSGFGNIVMIIHPGGWVTLYAHNSINFVVAGERVREGQIIAEVGSTGRSTGPHVHFELIFKGKNCNPASLWRPGIRHFRGNMSRIRQRTWTDPKGIPSFIQCGVRKRHPRPVESESFGENAEAELPHE